MKKIKNRMLSFLLIALLGLNLFGCGEAMELVFEEVWVTGDSIEGKILWESEAEIVQEDTSETEIAQEDTSEAEMPDEEELQVVIDGEYTSKEEVALYIHLYEQLPGNYISKKEAQELGWNSKEGNLWDVAPGMSIGGSYFGNYEGLLPEKDGRKYYECDIDYEGGYRGAKRIIYSNDGLIFYTDDHYESFEQLY